MGEEKTNDVSGQEQCVEDVNNSQVAQAGRDVTQNQKNYFFVGDDERTVGAFSLERAIGLKKNELSDAKRYFVYPEAQLKTITAFLEDKHFIFLTGEECRGKFYTAKYLSCLLTEANNSLEALLVESIGSNNYVNLLDLVNEEGAIKNKVIIFKDVLKKANPQLKEFFCSMTKERFSDLSQKLINMNTYFIFTADDSTLTDIPIENIEANKRVKKLDSTIIMIGINKRLQDFFTSNKSISKEHVIAFLKDHQKKLTSSFDRMSQATFFVEKYLAAVLLDKMKLKRAIAEVLKQAKYLETWFLETLGGKDENFEAWTFVVCLAIFNECSYADFYELHRSITSLLINKFYPFESLQGFSFSKSEGALLKKCKARMFRAEQDEADRGDRVGFCEPEYRDDILKILLANHRNVLFHLVPILKEYVEKQGVPIKRRMGAISLGRICSIDPQSLLEPIVYSWAKSPNLSLRAGVAYLLEGYYSGQDLYFKSNCKQILERLAGSNTSSERWTGIVALRYFAFEDFDFSMEKLREIHRAVTRDSSVIKKFEGFLNTDSKYSTGETASINLESIYGKGADLLKAILYSIVALAISYHLPSVIEVLRKWMNDGETIIRGNVALFVLGKEGILQEIERRGKEAASGSLKKQRSSNNRFLHFIMNDEIFAKNLALFWADLYGKCVSVFPIGRRNDFRRKLIDTLKKWVIKSLTNDHCLESLGEIIVQFYQLVDDGMKSTIWESIKVWKTSDSTGDQKKLEEFIEDLTRKFFEK